MTELIKSISTSIELYAFFKNNTFIGNTIATPWQHQAEISKKNKQNLSNNLKLNFCFFENYSLLSSMFIIKK